MEENINQAERRIPHSQILRDLDVFLHDEHNYSLGGNRTSSFALGAVGAEDDFWLIGCFPDPTSPHWPVISGNLLDSQGRQLCMVVRNQIVFNPGDCMISFQGIPGFMILDTKQEPILKVSTSFADDDRAITAVTGDFYGRTGALICCATDAIRPIQLELAPGIGAVIGLQPEADFGKGLPGIVFDLSEIAIRSAMVAVQTAGRVHTTLEGIIENQTVRLDGKFLNGAILRNCDIVVERGEFLTVDHVIEENCTLTLNWPAFTIAQLLGARLSRRTPIRQESDASPPTE